MSSVCTKFKLAVRLVEGVCAGLEGQERIFGYLPSLMLATPGCCARDDMGAAFAGVFCGVLAGTK